MSGAALYFRLDPVGGNIPELNGLRGLAILLVFVRHAAHPVYAQHGYVLRVGNWDMGIPLLNGWMGVDLFFVLSGFLICHHLLNRWPDRFGLDFFARYWAKRVLRTFPAFYVAALIAAFGIVPMFEPHIADPAHTLWVHAFFLQDYLGTDLVPAFWSLGVEEKFYILCPFVLALTLRMQHRQRLAILCALAVLPLVLRLATFWSGAADASTYSSLFWTLRAPFHLATDGLWIGVICALLYRDRALGPASPLTANRLCTISLAALCALAVSSAWLDDVEPVQAAVVLNLTAIAFGGLTLAVASGPTFLRPLLVSTTLRRLAVLSYSLYLVHMMFVPLASSIATDIPGLADAPPLLQVAAMALVLGALSLIAALMLHFLVEKPFLRIKNQILLTPAGPSVAAGKRLVAGTGVRDLRRT